MIVASRTPQDQFTEARMEFEDLIAQLMRPASSELTHSEAEELIEWRGREVQRRLLQGWLDAQGLGEVGPALEGSDGVLRTHRREQGRNLESLFGTVRLERLGYGAEGCKSLHPLDARLNLPEELYSHAVRKKVALAAARSSFEEVVQTLEENSGAELAKRQAEELAGRAAQDFDAFYEQQRARPPAPQEPQSVPTDSILAMTTDGKGVPMLREHLREQTRKEADKAEHKLSKRLSRGEKRSRKRMATVAAVYSIEPHVRTAEDVVSELRRDEQRPKPERPKPQNKTVWASVQRPAHEVIGQMFDEAKARDPQGRKHWVVLVDGQEHQLDLLRREVAERKLNVTFTLDLIHVLGYVWSAAWDFFEEGKLEAEQWVSEQLLRLLQGRVRSVAAVMRRKATRLGLPPSERVSVDRCADYLLKYQDLLRYDESLEAGYPIATGVIEGACRYLVKDRMERTGARWGLTGAEAVLRLRALVKNGDFDDYWAFHLKHEYQRNHASRFDQPPPIGSTVGSLGHLRVIK